MEYAHAPAFIEIPSKVFLWGEYGALVGAPACVLAVNPPFRFSENTVGLKINSESPAGQLLQKASQQFPYRIRDPWANFGGMGRSGAEFVAAARALDSNSTPEQIWQKYRKYSAEVGSGYDVLTQAFGHSTLCSVNGEIKYQAFSPVDPRILHYGFLFYAGHQIGRKTTTHEDVKDRGHFFKQAHQYTAALSTNDLEFEKFISLIDVWYGWLTRIAPVHTRAHDDLADLKATVPELAFAKGCGARFSDSVVVWTKSGEITQNLLSWAGRRDLVVIGRLSGLVV